MSKLIVFFSLFFSLQSSLVIALERPLQQKWSELVQLKEMQDLSWQEQQQYKLIFYTGAAIAIMHMHSKSPTRNYTKEMMEDCNDFFMNLDPSFKYF